MFRKSVISFILVGVIVIAGGAAVSAQSAPVTGTVELQKADGTREPVAGALIEVYRVDIKAGFPSAKTNKKGEFSFAGLPLGATFVFSVSAPNTSPTIRPGVKAGQERILISMSPGDGSKYTEDEVRKGATAKPKTGGGESAELTPEQKKAQAEYESQKKAVEDKNKRASQTNEIVTAALKTGNEAFGAKNYDLAIAKYDEGIAADPDYVGSAPIFHNNRGTALMSRGVDTYNKSVKAADISEKVAGLGKTKSDFAEASSGYVKSWNILKNAPAADIGDRTNYEATRLGTLNGSIATFQMAVRTEQVDTATIEAAKILIPEYLTLEADATKKAQASLAFADLYRVVGDSENAIAAYKKILESSPNDLDALAGAGLSLVNLGYIEIENAKATNDKALTEDGKQKLQEGSNLLGKYAGAAPDTHKYKADAVALIDTLKKEQNVTPQKVTTTKAATVKKKP